MTEEQAQGIIERLDRIIQLLEQNRPAVQFTYTTPDFTYLPPIIPQRQCPICHRYDCYDTHVISDSKT